MEDLINLVQAQYVNAEIPQFRAGDTINVHQRIVEGNKERIQQFEGVVIQRRGTGSTETVTVRKISNGVGVERIIPIHSPNVEKIEVTRLGKVRRGRIFYQRQRFGKSSRIKELVAGK
ncbi:MAG: 50S ribosomal protein L19 [Bacteroidetes bacterium]|nr:50S ribosomal protein L19 [Bacteroidota bacterium]